MRMLETRAHLNGKAIDNQWIKENETNENFYNKSFDNSREFMSFQEQKEAEAILKGIQALQDEDKKIEDLKMVRDELKEMDKGEEEARNYYYDGEFLFESEEEHEKELEKIMG